MKKLPKQPWDKSTKDTPEYDMRLAQREIAKLQKQIAELKAMMGQK